MATVLDNFFAKLDKPKYDNLTEEKELELGKRAMENDGEAKEKLINAHLRWAVSKAKEYTGWSVPLEDLVQAANEGLVKAVDRFDPEKGRLFYFAKFFVLAELNRTLANESGAVSLSSSMRKKAYNAYLFYKEIKGVIKKGLPEEEAIDRLEAAMAKRDYWKYIEGWIIKEDKTLSLTFKRESEDVWVTIRDSDTDKILGKNKFSAELLFDYLTNDNATIQIIPSLRYARQGTNPSASIDIKEEDNTDKLTEDNIVDHFTTSRDTDVLSPQNKQEWGKEQFLSKIHEQKFKMKPIEWKAYKLRHGLRESGDGRYTWKLLLDKVQKNVPILLKLPLSQLLDGEYDSIPIPANYPGVYNGLGLVKYEPDDNSAVFYGANENMMSKNGIEFTEITGDTDELDYPWGKVTKTLERLQGELAFDKTGGRSLKEVALILDKSPPAIHNLEWEAKKTLFHNLEQEKLKSFLG